MTAVGAIHVDTWVAPNSSQWLSGTTNTNLEGLSLEVTLGWPDWTGSRKRIVHRPHGCTPPHHPPDPADEPQLADRIADREPVEQLGAADPDGPDPDRLDPDAADRGHPTQPTPTQPSPSPSLPIPPVPAEPTPILTMDCTSITIGLDNPAKGIEFKLHIEPSTGSDTDLVVKPGEKKTAKFAATAGFKLTVTISATYDGKSYSDTDTVDYVQPDDCTSGSGGGCPSTGAAAGPLAGGAAAAAGHRWRPVLPGPSPQGEVHRLTAVTSVKEKARRPSVGAPSSCLCLLYTGREAGRPATAWRRERAVRGRPVLVHRYHRLDRQRRCTGAGRAAVRGAAGRPAPR